MSIHHTNYLRSSSNLLPNRSHFTTSTAAVPPTHPIPPKTASAHETAAVSRPHPHHKLARSEAADYEADSAWDLVQDTPGVPAWAATAVRTGSAAALEANASPAM